MSGTNQSDPKALTLTFDIGGSHLKAGVLDQAGAMVGTSQRVVTPKPSRPAPVVEGLLGLAKQFSRFDRVSIGFPGVVRGDHVLTAPNLGTKYWHRFPLAAELSRHLGKPVRMLNDASIQGLGVITGHGMECVLTMGTGMGFALCEDGRLGPHMEISQLLAKKGKTYDQFVGEAALESIGAKHWNRRMREVIATMKTLTDYDCLYIGGGNARLINPPLPDNVKLVSNEAGITGGVRLWDKRMDVIFEDHTPFE